MRRRSCLAMLAILSLIIPASARADLVKLDRWQGPATAIRNPGPGQKLFELLAEVVWDRAAPPDPARYAVRLTLPDGQTTDRALEVDNKPGSRRLKVLVPAAAIRNLLPEAVKVHAVVIDATTGALASNTLDATIADFPTPKADAASGPFGWGRPLREGGGAARPLPREGPDGFQYVLIPASSDEPAFFLATTEASVGQVRSLLRGYDPKAGRSDEFALEEADQPAVNLTPAKALDALKGLGGMDKSGLTYRLPTRAEWLRAATAGKASAFWWGDEPTHPEGANLLGPEPALEADSTAPATPGESSPTFAANPWGLAHTFGNVAEWASVPEGGFARMGGHFRTEPASPLPDVKVDGPGEIGPDAYVGFRPAFSPDADEGARLARKALGGPAFAKITPTFDPARATVILEGDVPDPDVRRRADRLLRTLWFVAAVEDKVTSPTIAPGHLALLGEPTGPAKVLTPLARRVIELPLAVRWADALPVDGSELFVNIYGADGSHSSHALLESAPGASKTLRVLIDPPRGPVSAAISLGTPAPTMADARVVSNVVSLGSPVVGGR